jgi:hypothetical protein
MRKRWLSSFTISFERSIEARTVSVTSLGVVAPAFWPSPSATSLSAGHSPAWASVAKLIAAATTSPVAPIFTKVLFII